MGLSPKRRCGGGNANRRCYPLLVFRVGILSKPQRLNPSGKQEEQRPFSSPPRCSVSLHSGWQYWPTQVPPFLSQQMPYDYCAGAEFRMIEQPTITCPKCGHEATEQMPTNACQFFYDCTGCGGRLKPRPGDCYVFCLYGSVPYSPILEVPDRARCS
jgi:hypothetical protein